MNTTRGNNRHSSAFTLVELLVVIAIIALLISILLPGLACARVSARQNQSNSNLKQYAISTQSYSADFQDRIWAFTWRAATASTPRNFQSRYADLQNPTPNDDVQAAHYQAVDIFRRRAPNRDQGDPEMFPTQGAWIPHILYSHMVLLDYLAARLPEPMVRSPLDKTRERWAEDPIAARNQLHAQGIPSPTGNRWPYSSSYTLSLSTFTPDKFTIDGGYLRSLEYGLFQYVAGAAPSPRYRLGNRKLGDVAFPAQKVHSYETSSRVCGRPPKDAAPFIYFGAKTYATTFAGSVSLISMNSANKGGYTLANASPASAAGIQTAAVSYVPNIIIGDPLWPGNPAMANLVPLYFRHTLGGLKGLDFGGRDIYPANYAGMYPGIP